MNLRKPVYSATGYGPIDDEHHKLSAQIDALIQKVNDEHLIELKAAMARLIANVAEHFGHEEQLLAEYSAPNGERHKQAHQIFLADVVRAQRELDEKGLTIDFRRWAVGRLISWFRTHILAHDMGLAQFVLKARAAGAAPPEPTADGAWHAPPPH